MNNAALERLASVTERVSRVRHRPRSSRKPPEKPAKPEAYRWRAQTEPEAAPEEVATPKALKKALEHEKTPELSAKLAEESIARDAWAAEVSKLQLPKLVEQVALNAWKSSRKRAMICVCICGLRAASPEFPWRAKGAGRGARRFTGCAG